MIIFTPIVPLHLRWKEAPQNATRSIVATVSSLFSRSGNSCYRLLCKAYFDVDKGIEPYHVISIIEKHWRNISTACIDSYKREDSVGLSSGSRCMHGTYLSADSNIKHYNNTHPVEMTRWASSLSQLKFLIQFLAILLIFGRFKSIINTTEFLKFCY